MRRIFWWVFIWDRALTWPFRVSYKKSRHLYETGKKYMRRLRKTTKQPVGWPEMFSNEPELVNATPSTQFIWEVYETHTEDNLELKWGRDAIPKCPWIWDATANCTTLPRNLYETKMSHIKLRRFIWDNTWTYTFFFCQPFYSPGLCLERVRSWAWYICFNNCFNTFFLPVH